MSTRNSRAAKAARRAARQDHRPEAAPSLDKARIADAIHEAVCLVGRDEGVGHCDAYAFAGAIVLAVLTKQDWSVQGGAAYFGTGVDLDSPEGELAFAYVPSETSPIETPNGMTGPGGLTNGELHAWCARAQDGQAAEIADFSARHIPHLSRLCGFGWKREEPPYLWGTPRDLYEQRYNYRAELETVNLIHKNFSENTRSYGDAATLALWRLGHHTEDRARQLMQSPELLDYAQGGWKITQTFTGGHIMSRP